MGLLQSCREDPGVCDRTVDHRGTGNLQHLRKPNDVIWTSWEPKWGDGIFQGTQNPYFQIECELGHRLYRVASKTLNWVFLRESLREIFQPLTSGHSPRCPDKREEYSSQLRFFYPRNDSLVQSECQVPSELSTFLKLVFVLPDLSWLSGSHHCSFLLLLVNSDPCWDYSGAAFYRRYWGDFPLLECQEKSRGSASLHFHPILPLLIPSLGVS